jgi:hypothetical protein
MAPPAHTGLPHAPFCAGALSHGALPRAPNPCAPRPGLFLPASAFKAVRRAAAAAFLSALEAHPYAEGLAGGPVLPAMLAEARAGAPRLLPCAAAAAPGAVAAAEAAASVGEAAAAAGDQEAAAAVAEAGGGRQQEGPLIRVMCRTPEQVVAALKVEWLGEVILDFLEVRTAWGAGWRLGGKRALGPGREKQTGAQSGTPACRALQQFGAPRTS